MHVDPESRLGREIARFRRHVRADLDRAGELLAVATIIYGGLATWAFFALVERSGP